MAVFMINICKFNGCGITFPRLADLIEHIEDVHIDYDPAVVEQKEASQPACIPLSYVLKFFTEATRRDFHSMPPVAPADVRRRQLSAPTTASVRSSTPTGSEMDEDDLMTPSEDSNDSWTAIDEYSSEYILRYGVKTNGASAVGLPSPSPHDKPFACPVPGCLKRYKNVNGIKYHSKNGHKKDGKIKKGYRCPCGKSYKTAQGLKTHSMTNHVGTGQSATVPGNTAANVTSSGNNAASVTSPGNNAASVTSPGNNVAGITSSGNNAASVTARAHASPLTGLVVTAAPHRPLFIDNVDGNKLVRIYDSIKARDLPTFTIPKHSLNIVRGAVTKIDRSRVTVQTAHSVTPSFATESN